MAKKQIEDICERLANAFASSVPRDIGAKGGRKPSEKLVAAKVDSGLQRFYEEARLERERHQLGVIGRARVAFGLQEHLLAQGYPPVLVKKVLFALLVSSFVGKQR